MNKPLYDHSSRITAFDEIQQKRTHRNMTRLYFVVIGISLSTLYLGWNMIYLSTIKNATLQATFGSKSVNPTIYGVLIGCIPIGAALGSLLSQIPIRFLSRRNFLIICNFVAIVVSVIIQIPNIYVLLVSRIFQGILIGHYITIVPVYINQLSPTAVVGSMGVFTQLGAIFGGLFSYVAGLIFILAGSTGELMWRFMFSFSTVIVLLQLLMIFTGFIPQSPTSLLQDGKRQEAKEILLIFNTENVIEKVLQDKQNALSKDTNKQDDKIKPTHKSIALGCFLLPLLQQLCGINTISTEIGQIISKMDSQLSIYVPVIAMMIQGVASIFSIYGFSKWGRRPTILVGNLSLVIIDALIGVLFIFSDWQPALDMIIGLISLFMVIFGLTLGPLSWIYSSRILTPKLFPITSFMSWVACSICMILPPIIIDVVGSPYPIFLGFSCICGIFFIFNYCWVVEIKGLTVTEINAKFHN